MDKMLVSDDGDVVITNDGATILSEMDIEHPAAQMIVEVAQTQEDEVGDGTTTASVLAGELLTKGEDLLDDDVHPTTIVEGYSAAAELAQDAINELVLDVDLDDETLVEVAESSMTGKGTGDVEAENSPKSSSTLSATPRATTASAGTTSKSTPDGCGVLRDQACRGRHRRRDGRPRQHADLGRGRVHRGHRHRTRRPREQHRRRVQRL